MASGTAHTPPVIVEPAPPQLLRVLGIAFGLAVVVGSVIGAGIMRAPGVVARAITNEPMFLFAWIAGGAVCMLSAMPVVEAGASVPRAGGAFPIAERAFGTTVGLLAGWITWLGNVSAVAYVAVVFGEYVHRLGLAAPIPTSAVAGGLIFAAAAMNLAGTRATGASQAVASAVKGAGFLVLTVVLLASPHAALSHSTSPAVAAGARVAGIGGVIMAIRVIYATYNGWIGAIFFSEEVRRPERALARATFTGIVVVTTLYVLINIAVLHVLTPAAIAGSELAVGDAAKAVVGAAGDTAITAFGLFSLAALANLNVMKGSRITFCMARDGVLPKGLAAVSTGGTPVWSVAILVFAAVLLAASGGYETLVRISAPWTICAVLIITFSAIRLRVAEPALARPWKMPLFPLPAIIAAAIQASLLALMVWDDPLDGLWSAATVVAPLPIWLIFERRWRREAVDSAWALALPDAEDTPAGSDLKAPGRGRSEIMRRGHPDR